MCRTQGAQKYVSDKHTNSTHTDNRFGASDGSLMVESGKVKWSRAVVGKIGKGCEKIRTKR